MPEAKRILAVDDEPSARLLITRVLTRAGFNVHTAENGEEAIAHLKAHPVDLLIVDKNLPKMSGLEVVAQARRTLPGLPVVMITAAPEPYAAAQQRPEVYLAKPFKNLQALENAVRDAFELNAAAAAREQLKRELDAIRIAAEQRQSGAAASHLTPAPKKP